MRDIKYLLAYTIPASAIVGINLGGIGSYTTVLYAFGLIPLWFWFSLVPFSLVWFGLFVCGFGIGFD